MKIHLISIGKIRESFYKAAAEEYLKRLNGFSSILIKETVLSPVKVSKNMSSDQIKEQESILLFKHLPDNKIIIALDERGQEFSSPQLAQHLQQYNPADITFVMGGHAGLSSKIRSKAKLVLSLSKLTFPHQLARVIFWEQVYRVACILGGKKYHR